MNNKFVGFVMFALGAAVGSAVTWRFLKTKYEQIAQEEIDSVKEVFARRNEKEKVGETEIKDQKPSLQELANQIKTLQYETGTASENKNDSKEQRPYVIPPDEFGQEDNDYDLVSLNYYKDGVLTDDFDVPIENADDIVGLESLKHFGDNDYVFVRNDRLKVEYEIFRDERNFSDVVSNDPYSEEEE